MGDVFELNKGGKPIPHKQRRSTQEIWAELVALTMLGSKDLAKREALREELATGMRHNLGLLVPVINQNREACQVALRIPTGLIRHEETPNIRIQRNPYLQPTKENKAMVRRVEETWEVIPADQLEIGQRFRRTPDGPEHIVKEISVTPWAPSHITTEAGLFLELPSYEQVEYLQRRVLNVPLWRTAEFWLPASIAISAMLCCLAIAAAIDVL